MGRSAYALHFDYLLRKGGVEIENDGGRQLNGEGIEAAPMDNWDLDLDQTRPSADLKRHVSQRPKATLVHKLMFSMPAGTPAQKVTAAARTFAR